MIAPALTERHHRIGTTDWAFPTYGDGLPHDLCHLVVEDELGLLDGFWGLVDQQVEVGLVDNQATLMRDGRPLADQPGVDLSGLTQAEAAVAALGSPMRLVEPDELDGGRARAELAVGATPEAARRISARLEALARAWRSLEDGGAITLSFPTRAP